LGWNFKYVNDMQTRFIFLFLLTLTLFSCSKNQITLPPDNPDTNLINTLPLSDSVLRGMEGIYTLSGGNSGLGTQFVCKASKYKLSFFSNTSGIFMILDYGLNPADSSIQFSGFWRYSETATQGLINMSISKAGGSVDFLRNGITMNLTLQGNFGDQHSTTQPMTLKFSRAFSTYAIQHGFQIYAHHGVQTTSNPPYAQNSILGVLHDEDYGVNGLEFDIQLTKDHVPICMHDDDINIRLTEKGPLSGNYSQYGFAFLEQYIRLIDGQQIPSLEHALQVFVDSTTLKYFWMDVKGDPDIFKYLEPVVRNAYAHATAVNRNVVIFADMPSKEVIDEFKSWPAYADLPTMCETSLQDVIDNKSAYWGPRYTEGLLLDDVARAHSQGIKVLSWTLNDKTLIRNYLENGQFDGFISDYPAYVVYDYYTMF
jgi:glycerophosphoryl diester phosphodiesterase